MLKKKGKTILATISVVFVICIVSAFLFFKKNKIIYVYNDQGAGLESIKHTLSFFEKNFPHIKVETITAEDIIQGKKLKHASLFVMPGGADLPYLKKLRGIGNQNIKDYVEAGGAYLGLCAGAYYGSNYVEFDKNGKLEVLGARELSFFPGKSVGPILAPYVYKSHEGARAALIDASLESSPGSQSKKIYVFYNGGGTFEDAENVQNVKVLAYYETNEAHQLPAVIYIKRGQGQVILSGVHFEYQSDLLDKNDIYLKDIIPKIEETQLGAKEMTHYFLSLLGIH